MPKTKKYWKKNSFHIRSRLNRIVSWKVVKILPKANTLITMGLFYFLKYSRATKEKKKTPIFWRVTMNVLAHFDISPIERLWNTIFLLFLLLLLQFFSFFLFGIIIFSTLPEVASAMLAHSQPTKQNSRKKNGIDNHLNDSHAIGNVNYIIVEFFSQSTDYDKAPLHTLSTTFSMAEKKKKQKIQLKN